MGAQCTLIQVWEGRVELLGESSRPRNPGWTTPTNTGRLGPGQLCSLGAQLTTIQRHLLHLMAPSSRELCWLLRIKFTAWGAELTASHHRHQPECRAAYLPYPGPKHFSFKTHGAGRAPHQDSQTCLMHKVTQAPSPKPLLRRNQGPSHSHLALLAGQVP